MHFISSSSIADSILFLGWDILYIDFPELSLKYENNLVSNLILITHQEETNLGRLNLNILLN